MKKYMPYEIDLKFQYRTYKNIGKTYKIDFESKKSWWYKVRKVVRNAINKSQKRYKTFDTFSQWENYIHEEFNVKKFNNKTDYIHYLEFCRRNKEISYEMVGAVATPMYVFMLTVGMTLLMSEDEFFGYIVISVILFMVLPFLMNIFITNKRKYNFYNDLIMVLKKIYQL